MVLGQQEKTKQYCRVKNLPPPPKPPLSRLIREGSIGDCPLCKSTQMRKHSMGMFFNLGPIIGCIHPECKNYYKRCQ